MNTMNRKVAMCSQLNMSFDEANELFGEESLESMQMARVNGGVVLTVATIATIIGSIAGLATLGYMIYQDQRDLPKDGSTPASMSESVLKELLKTKAGPGFEMTCDSIVGDKWYGFRIKFETPTPM